MLWNLYSQTLCTNFTRLVITRAGQYTCVVSPNNAVGEFAHHLEILCSHTAGFCFVKLTHEFSRLASFPLKSLVADSNNKLQSDQSIEDQLAPLKSLRMRGWGKNQFAIYIRLMSVENTMKQTAPRIQV